MGCAALLGALIAFPAGMMFASRTMERAPPPAEARAGGDGKPVARDPYSASILSDPYFIERQRELADQLEMSCRQFNQYCAEAKQVRERVNELAGKN